MEQKQCDKEKRKDQTHQIIMDFFNVIGLMT